MNFRIHQEIESDGKLKSYLDNLQDTGPINLRDAFMGGRTGAEYLYAKAPTEYTPEAVLQANRKAVEKKDPKLMHTTIKFKDFKSLYPAMLAQIVI
jgi:hypothetical protein